MTFRNMDSLAEQAKLERLLEVEAGSIDFIADSPAENTRAFRENLSDFFYRRHEDAYRRLAGMSKLLPLGVSAKLATGLLGPVLSAGIACELPLDKAIKLADKLPTEFLARLALHLEPKRAAPIIAAINEDHIVAVAKELSNMKEFVTLARFVSSISSKALQRVIDNADEDGASLLRTGMYIEDKSIIDSLFRLLSEQQQHKLLSAANHNLLWPETLSLLAWLKPDMQILMANLAGAMEETAREKLLRAIDESGDWKPFFIAVAAMNDDSLKRAAALPALHDEALLKRLRAAAKALKMEKELQALFGYFDAEQRTLLA